MHRIAPLLALTLACLLAAAVPAGAQKASGAWLSADMHVHSCYSHDSYCGPDDDNTGPETAYSSGASVANRFLEASLKGLDGLLVSDHNDVRAQSDAAFGSQGVIGLRGYEHSLAGGGGHAQLIGATGLLPEGPSMPRSAAAEHTSAIAAALERAGGVFQANHPSYRGKARFERCDQAELAAWDTSPLHYKQGFGVPPGTVEVWNPTTLIEPGEVFWECLLQTGHRVAATAGSDSHGTNQANLGRPLTWVHARERSEAALLAAVRTGRTTLARDRNIRLLLEADADRDGRYEAMIGDTVPPRTPMRVRADGPLPVTGQVDVRANGQDLLSDAELGPNDELPFAAPAEAPGWVRATLRLPMPISPFDPNCGASGQSLSFCSADLAMAAMTSPIYVGRAPAGNDAPVKLPAPGPPPSGEDEVPEPDEQRPLPPAIMSGDGRLPAVPARSASSSQRPNARIRTASRFAVRLRRTGRRHRRVRFAVRVVAPARTRVDVQVRIDGRFARALGRATQRRSFTFSARRGQRVQVRIRARRADGSPGAWRASARARRA